MLEVLVKRRLDRLDEEARSHAAPDATQHAPVLLLPSKLTMNGVGDPRTVEVIHRDIDRFLLFYLLRNLVRCFPVESPSYSSSRLVIESI